MGKKLKGGRRQILQLEEKKPPKTPKSKMKSLIHYSDSDDEDSKKSNDSEQPSTVQKDATPLDSEIADFFKEIDALSVPEELMEQSSSSPAQEESAKPVPTQATILEPPQDSADLPPSEADSHNDEQKEEIQCAWQEICDDSTGYSYYWNMHTNEVTWDRPEEYTNYTNSLNSACKENNHSVVSTETNADGKKSKRKKESPQLPEGAIIPISYYGNSSSEGESDSERESAHLAKKKKVEKPATSKKNKSLKKQSAKSKMTEEECKTEIIGPQLPPDFQFPLGASADPAIERKETEKHVELGPFLPADFPIETLKSKPEDIPVEQSISENSIAKFVKDIEANSEHSNEQPAEKSGDSMVKKEASIIIQGYRPVVDYDSFTDEDEDTNKEASSNQVEAIKTKSIETKLDVEDKDLILTSSQSPLNSEAEIFTKSTKRKTANEPKIKSNELTTQSDKKYLKTNVDIDSLFAAHSSYGKHGFGFGFREQDEEIVESRQDFKSRRGQMEKKAVSFVKSDLVLNLGSLNDAVESEAESPTVLDNQITKAAIVEKAELQDSAETEETKNDVLSEKGSSSSSEEGECSSSNSPKNVRSEECEEAVTNGNDDEIKESLKPNANDSVVQERSDSPDTSTFELTDDLDEIDKALCEALYKKKAQSGLKSSSVSIQTSTDVLQKDLEPQVTEPGSPQKSERKDSEMPDDTEFKTRMVDMASILIDKLTFLLSSSSATLPSLNSLFVQLQTRFVDWQANALDNHYFEARVKEVNDYLLHYETGVVSGDWTCQWDRYRTRNVIMDRIPNCFIFRVNKRYFYLNRRSQFSQWTFPEELCTLEETSFISSKMDSTDAVMADQTGFSTVASSVVDFRGAPSPPPPPPGVDSPPPLPPQSPPPSTPPPPPDSAKIEMEPEDMDLENSNDSNSQGDFLAHAHPASPSMQSPQHTFLPTTNLLSSPLFPSSESRSLFPILSHDSRTNELVPTSYLEGSTTPTIPVEIPDESTIPVGGSTGSEVPASETQTAKQSKAAKPASVPVKRKKTKIQPGLGLKKKNIPSLVEKWQKIKEEQEREDKSNDSKLPITF